MGCLDWMTKNFTLGGKNSLTSKLLNHGIVTAMIQTYIHALQNNGDVVIVASIWKAYLNGDVRPEYQEFHRLRVSIRDNEPKPGGKNGGSSSTHFYFYNRAAACYYAVLQGNTVKTTRWQHGVEYDPITGPRLTKTTP
jgi:hypothetical protein